VNTTGQSPGQALANIPGFADARIEARLSDGPTNASYQLELSGRRYVLRIDKPEAAGLGLDRVNEKLIAEAASTAGLSPAPLYFEPAEGLYLREFQEGRNWTPSDLENPENMTRLARLLRTLHSLEPVGAVFDPLAAARRYAAQLDTAQARLILDRAEKQVKKLAAGSPRPALCHNDLVCQNVLEGERLMLIDWEYAGIGDPFFDLAVLVQHHGLDEPLARCLLENYLERTVNSGEFERLSQQCDFYQCLLQLWNLRTV